MRPVLKVIGELAYFRLRNDRYDLKSIDEWSARIRDVSKDSKEIYVYLRHDETGENAANALRLVEEIQKKG